MSGSQNKNVWQIEKEMQKRNETDRCLPLNRSMENIRSELLTEIKNLEEIRREESFAELTQISIRLALDKHQLQKLEVIEELNERDLNLTDAGLIQTKSDRLLTIENAKKLGFLNGIDINNLQLILLREKLIASGVCMTEFGRFINMSGSLLSLDELKRLSIIEDADIDLLLHRSNKSCTSILSSDKICSEDVKYLKAVVGKPLTIALAEIVAKQPKDPIHYLGHWLFKYRYNQEVSEIKKKEILELEAERERMKKQKQRMDMEYATKSCLLDIIFRAHDDASKTKLAQMNKENGENITSNEINEYFDEEARDILGELVSKSSKKKKITF